MHWDHESRQDALDKGHALPPDAEGGEPRYPIETRDDVRDAVEDYHRDPGDERVRAFITRRAVDLGATDLLPEDWRLVKVEGEDTDESGDDDHE
jgi:hypothetical protein